MGVMTFDVSNFLNAHPLLVQDVAGHSLAHALYSHVRRGRHGRANRRQLRKEVNRKRRWFVDNIIMHHKRLHDRNRATVVFDVRSRVLARRKELEKNPLSLQKSSTAQQDHSDSHKWRNAVSLKDRGAEMRGRADAKRLRARSRWLSVMGSTS